MQLFRAKLYFQDHKDRSSLQGTCCFSENSSLQTRRQGIATMSQVQYTRLPTGSSPSKDSVGIDFGSAFTFKSAFTYSKSVPPFMYEEKEYKPSLVYKVLSYIVICLSYLLLFLTFPVSGWLAIKMVQQFERIVVYRLGRLQAPQGPGMVLINPFIDTWKKVDMRTRAFNVPPQQIITYDGAAISAGATVYHRISDVVLSTASVQDMDHSIRTLGHTILLNLLSSRELSNIEREKGFLNACMQEVMNEVTQNWGVEVSRTEISEITVVQEAAPPSFNFQAVTNVFTQVAGQVTAGSKGSAQPPSGFASLLSAATAGQSAMAPQTSPSLSLFPAPPQQQQHTQQQQLPGLTAPRQVPITSNLVELSGQSLLTPEELLASAQPLMTKELVREIGAVFKFVVTGEGGGTYYLDLKTGSGEAGVGNPSTPPDVTLTMTVGDMRAMFQGELRPAMAYMMGRLQVEGDRNVALSLETIINRIQESRK